MVAPDARDVLLLIDSRTRLPRMSLKLWNCGHLFMACGEGIFVEDALPPSQ
jgi:hypothetical protein